MKSLFSKLLSLYDFDVVFSHLPNHSTCLQVMLALFDTAGQEEYDRLRPLSYNNTNIVLISFSVGYPPSAQNVIAKWNPEVRHYCGPSPVILVACKIDLRTDAQTIERLKCECQKPVAIEDGRKIAAQIKADAYMECSAKTREGVEEVFVHAARLSLQRTKKKTSMCTLN